MDPCLPDSLRSLVLDMRALAPFPHVASTVLAVAARPNSLPEQLIEVIQTDPGLTAKVLKLCNSAYYGFQREIASLGEAGNAVGVRTLTNLVLTSCASRYFEDASPSPASDGWESAVKTAVAARLLARSSGRTDPERAYTSGLLLNVGGLVLDRYLASERARIEAEVQAGRPRIQAERAILGLSHAEIGARLVTRWTLPEVLVDTIRHHHNPERASLDPSLTATVHLAEAFSTSLPPDDEQGSMAPEDWEVAPCAWRVTGLRPGDFALLEPRLRQELRQAQALLVA